MEALYPRVVKLEHSDAGNWPVRPVLPLMYNDFRFVRYDSVLGMVPVSWLLARFNMVSLDKLPIVAGRGPVKSLLRNERIRSCFKSPIEFGIVPVNFIFSR